ncbi:MAG: hypothetical protein WC729_30030 [Sphingomonas sp.]|uniref:hypothetical protein n=1 Tax=Sphingomonas sp. TaxID=28214 RepID=UPI0035644E75
MDSLALEVSKLAALAARGDQTDATQMLPRVESLLSIASRAGATYGAFHPVVPADVQQRWVSILTRTQSALQAARAHAVSGPSSLPILLPAGAPDPRDGFKIPFTNIVLPWAAVLGVALVVGVGLYVSRRRK